MLKPIKEHRLFPLLRHLILPRRLALIKKRFTGGSPIRALIQEDAPSDTLHANSIQILKKPISSIAPAGAILLSIREINQIVILSPDMSRVLWKWGQGALQEQHHATLLENGNIMVFDNGVHRRQSRVLEINPVTKKVAWSYTAPGFYTRLRGAAQKLPGGNVLATESDKGHAFEVTPEGKVVWEFWNPDVVGIKNPKRAVIYRLTRYPRKYLKRALPDASP